MQQGRKKKKVISILGLTFKPNTDDMDSPSLEIIPALIKNNCFLKFLILKE